MIFVFQVLLIITSVVIFWIYIGYPLVLVIAVPVKKITEAKSVEFFPSLTLIIPTYNEARVIQKKIQNVHELVYPKDKFEMILVDSASTDGTEKLARQFDPTMKVVQLGHKPGKARAINSVLPESRGSIIVVTDANAYMHPMALRNVVQVFTDPKVGAATGSMRQVPYGQDAVSKGGGFYWSMEMFMRTREAQLHSVVSMSGELSAVRRELLVDSSNVVRPWYVPRGTDDFEMTLWVIQHGFRVAYVPSAKVWEYAPDNIRDLFNQKVRIIVQTITTVKRNLSVVWKTGLYGIFIFPSRKILPLLSPWCILLLTASATFLVTFTSIWKVLSSLVLVGVSILVLSSILPIRGSFFRLARFFVLLNATVFVAWVSYWRGVDFTQWQTVASTRR